MDYRRTETGFCVVDAVSTSLRVETDGWRETDDAPSVEAALDDRVAGPDDPDLTVSGRTRRLSFPNVLLQVIDLDDGSVFDFSAESDTTELTTGNYVLGIETSIRAYLRFEGRAEISRVEEGRVDVTFPDPTAVSVAFEQSVDGPDSVVRVPETVAGVAAGVETFASAAEVQTADRSWPSVRDHPPLLRFDSERQVPDSVRTSIPDTGIELVVPRDLQYVLTSASLSYYLGASITVADDCVPRLRLDGETLSLGPESRIDTHDSVTEERVGSVAAYASRCARLLRRVVFSDCLVRVAGDHGRPIVGVDAEDDLGLDTDSTFDAPLADRVRRYLDAPFETVSNAVPDWSVALSVDSRFENAATLSRTAHRLPAIAPATADTTTRSDTTAEPLDRQEPTLRGDGAGEPVGGARSTETAGTDATLASPEHVRPTHVWGRVHGWLADGVPVEGYDGLAVGFENRDRFRATTADTPSITVVLNGTDDHAELARAVEHYRRRTGRLDLDVSVRTNLSVAELARTFERRTDLLHFVGHREAGGLECPDGYFSPETLRRSNARTFFLNACGSHPTGATLVEKGSVAGGVTTRDVIDEMAAEVGVTMARLLACGFTVADAMAEARRVAVVPSDYLVVGDGTHVVTQSDNLGTTRMELSPVGTDAERAETFRLTKQLDSPHHVGADSISSLDEGPARHLFGTTREYELAREEVREFLSVAGPPIWYDRELVAPTKLLDRLFD